MRSVWLLRSYVIIQLSIRHRKSFAVNYRKLIILAKTRAVHFVAHRSFNYFSRPTMMT